MDDGLMTKWGKIQDVKTASESSLSVGSGFSKNPDAYTAAKEAAQQALVGLNGKKPTLSYVFFSGDYDPQALTKGLLEILKDTEFVGGMGGEVIYDDQVMEKGVVVASIQSDFLHVGIASVDNASENSFEAAKKVTAEALSKISIDNYIDPYMQAQRLQGGNIRGIVKIPPYYIHVFVNGLKLPKMGEENKIILGISNVVGRQVPIWGGSFDPALEKLMDVGKYEIYSLHSGKVYKDGLIVIFTSTSVLYGYSMAHGAKKSGSIEVIGKVSSDGYILEEISGQKPVEWYAKKLNMDKKKFIDSVMTLGITQRWPIGMVDNLGNIIVRGGGIPTGKNGESLAYAAPLVEGAPIFLMDGDPKNLFDATNQIINDIQNYTEETSAPKLVLLTSCLTRKGVMKDQFPKDLKKLKSGFGGSVLLGFTTGGEIGSKEGDLANCHHLTNNVFVFYNTLLINKKAK